MMQFDACSNRILACDEHSSVHLGTLKRLYDSIHPHRRYAVTMLTLRATHVGDYILEPRVRFEQLGEPFSSSCICVFGPVVDYSVLEMNTCFWDLFRQACQFRPCVPLELCFWCAFFAYL